MGASATSSNRFPEIEKYDLIEEIGHGGMATVYRARDHRLERDVAVKVIHKHLRENQEVRRRFVSEAKAVAKLRHAGIVEVYDVSDEPDIERYLVVELIDGMSLRQLLQQRECLPPEVAATMVSMLCDAVEHAHSQSVIHRDIKPENVLLALPTPTKSSTDDAGSSDPGADDEADSASDTSGRTTGARSGNSMGGSARSARSRVIVKLTDFGIAKVLDAQGVTSTGQILGSPAHMAPEQIEGGAIGPHTDVFGLGVLFYECMVGHLPFEGRNPAQVLRRVLEGDFDPADSERPAVGGRWARIVGMALANDIESRVASAAELGRLIDEELEALGIDDPRGAMVDYFLDPDAYTKKTGDILVPRLLERGEAERRIGNTPDAAADFNRALALRPDDLTILKRITSLSAQTVWRERALRGGAIVLGSLALGGVAFGVTKLAKSGETTAAVSAGTVGPSAPSGTLTRRASDPPILGPDPAPVAPASAPTPSSRASGSTSTSRKGPPVPTPGPVPSATASASATPPPSGETHPVAFRIWPGHVRVRVGGQQVGNHGRLRLAAGDYTVTASAKCCSSHSQSLRVVDAEPDKPPQLAIVTLKLKAASVMLSGAPPGASLSCPGVGLVVPSGGSSSVTIQDPSQTVQCSFVPSGKTASVTLTAGVTTSVQWP